MTNNNQENGMSRSELEHQFKTIGENMHSMKSVLDKINERIEKISERQQKHYNDLTKVEKDIEFIKHELEETKEENKTIIDNYKKEDELLWSELRRRDKKTMWIVGLIVTVSMGIMGVMVALVA